jgi:methyl-accepting chemotaxis protein
MAAANGESYERGVTAGQIAQRLKEHDQHLDKINGSMGDVADKLGQLTLQMQRMADALDADRATVITTAKALKDAKEASEQRWSPLTRFGIAVGTLTGLGGFIAWLAGAFRH